MTEALPDPLTPADCDLRDFPYMGIDVVRLRDSDLAAHDNAEVFRTAVLSWCIAWHQLPAGSLPDDDAKLARLFGFGRDLETWKNIRHVLGGLYGWVLCSDGRLYHPVVAAKAIEAVERREKNKSRTNKATKARLEKRNEQRNDQRDEGRNEQRDEERNEADTSERDDDRDGSPKKNKNNKTDKNNKSSSSASVRGFSAEDLEAGLIVQAFDAALVDAFGAQRARPFPAGTDIVHAKRWAAMGLTATQLYDLFAVRQRSRKDKGRDPIGSLAFLEQAVAEMTQAPTTGPAAPNGQVRFLSPAAELQAREDWAAREAMAAKGRGESISDFGAFGLVYDAPGQCFRLKPGSRPPIPPPQAKTG